MKHLGTAHGKIILMGEHSVVYGHRAIAMPLTSAWVEVAMSIGQDLIDSQLYKGSLDHMPDHMDHLKQLLTQLKKDYQRDDQLTIVIDSQILPGRGMGSSAAITNAIIRAFFSLYHLELSEDTLFKYSMIAETIAHGQPSGIDTLATASLVPILFSKDGGPTSIDVSLSGYLVVGDSGIEGSTHQAVRDVRQRVLLEDGIKHIERLSELAEEFLASMHKQDMDRCGELMNEAHHQLDLLTVSHPVLDEMTQDALLLGAKGSKLTGGGRGGCAIALTDSQAMASKIMELWKTKYSPHVWIMELK